MLGRAHDLAPFLRNRVFILGLDGSIRAGFCGRIRPEQPEAPKGKLNSYCNILYNAWEYITGVVG